MVSRAPSTPDDGGFVPTWHPAEDEERALEAAALVNYLCKGATEHGSAPGGVYVSVMQMDLQLVATTMKVPQDATGVWERHLLERHVEHGLLQAWVAEAGGEPEEALPDSLPPDLEAALDVASVLDERIRLCEELDGQGAAARQASAPTPWLRRGGKRQRIAARLSGAVGRLGIVGPVAVASGRDRLAALQVPAVEPAQLPQRPRAATAAGLPMRMAAHDPYSFPNSQQGCGAPSAPDQALAAADQALAAAHGQGASTLGRRGPCRGSKQAGTPQARQQLGTGGGRLARQGRGRGRGHGRPARLQRQPARFQDFTQCATQLDAAAEPALAPDTEDNTKGALGGGAQAAALPARLSPSSPAVGKRRRLRAMSDVPLPKLRALEATPAPGTLSRGSDAGAGGATPEAGEDALDGADLTQTPMPALSSLHASSSLDAPRRPKRRRSLSTLPAPAGGRRSSSGPGGDARAGSGCGGGGRDGGGARARAGAAINHESLGGAGALAGANLNPKNPGGAGALAGMRLLVTGLDEPGERRRVEGLLRHCGAVVCDAIPPVDAPADAVVAGRPCPRRAKWQLAVATGLPLLTPAWVAACAAAGARAPMSGAAHAWLPRNPNPSRPLAGMRVHLAGAAGFVSQYGALLPHAGTSVVKKLPAAIQWLGEPLAAPGGARAPALQHRRYYSGFVRGDMVVRVGDDVRLAPALGEAAVRVAHVEALWAEPQQRCLANLRRYYHPEETVFAGSGSVAELFASNHIEPRVPLAAVVSRPLTAAEVEALAKKLGTWLGALRKVEVQMAVVRPSDVVVPVEIGLSRIAFQDKDDYTVQGDMKVPTEQAPWDSPTPSQLGRGCDFGALAKQACEPSLPAAPAYGAGDESDGSDGSDWEGARAGCAPERVRSTEGSDDEGTSGEEAGDDSDSASDTAGGGGGAGGSGGGRRRPRKGNVAHITMQLLEDGGHFDSPIQNAAATLQVGVTTLKKICRKYNILRWPYRKRFSQHKLIERVTRHISEAAQPPNAANTHSAPDSTQEEEIRPASAARRPARRDARRFSSRTRHKPKRAARGAR
ncbi:hypothetical protein WJX81_008452 [Elliptochloris bilobata]|uniref:RWP-RK domain-containing protein n=1 Tax=Elliptochloris bilobata TaxID=381761 RepID=A0AAW1RMQ6_9CHLO